MPLEDLTGNKYIGDLQPLWPLGSDYPSDGDDHIRGIKNVLQQTFPNLTGPVTLTQGELNRGSVPSGSRMVFYQAAAPEGWTRVPNLDNTYMIRIRASGDGGGGSGGTDNPVNNGKVPSHTHVVSGNTATKSHSHSLNINNAGSHDHTAKAQQSEVQVALGSGETVMRDNSGDTGSAGAHSHSGSTSGGDHSHSVNITSASNSGASNWTPRYLNMIVCQKD